MIVKSDNIKERKSCGKILNVEPGFYHLSTFNEIIISLKCIEKKSAIKKIIINSLLALNIFTTNISMNLQIHCFIISYIIV